MAEGNILIIDDEVVMCELLTDILQEKGYMLKHALSGGEGIKAFKEGKFDVVMCDLKMPDMDGIKVLEEIKKLDPDSTFIVMTGYPSFDTIQAALRLGGFDYITKPFDIKEVSFAISRAFDFRNLTLANKRLIKELKEQNVKLEERVKEKPKEPTLLDKTGRDVSPILKLNEVFEIVLDRICRILDLEICSILLIDKDTEELGIRAARGISTKIISQEKIKKGESISGWVVQHNEAVLVEDIESDPRFAQRIKERYYAHSFISAPLVVKDEVIGVINANSKRSKKPLTKGDLRFLKGVADGAAITLENAQLYSSLENSYIRTIMSLTSAIDSRDHYTKSHSEHVTKYAVAITKEMGFSEAKIDEIKQACQLHDLGKIGVHDYILTKPDKLNPKEWEEIKLHSLKSAEILRPLVFLGGVIELVEQHHERYDGKGYPNGFKGEKIQLGARIIAVADSFDAMSTDRSYHKALSRNEAVEELKKGSGTQFDPKVVEIFLRVLEKNPEIVKHKAH